MAFRLLGGGRNAIPPYVYGFRLLFIARVGMIGKQAVAGGKLQVAGGQK